MLLLFKLVAEAVLRVPLREGGSLRRRILTYGGRGSAS